MTTIAMAPPDAVHLSITTASGRTYTATAGGTVQVQAVDVPCLQANGWTEAGAQAGFIAQLQAQVAQLQQQVAAGGGSGGAAPQSLYAVGSFTKGQTGFTLPLAPVITSDVGLVVNGIEYLSPDVSVSGSTLTWNGAFLLDPATDAVFFRYH